MDGKLIIDTALQLWGMKCHEQTYREAIRAVDAIEQATTLGLARINGLFLRRPAHAPALGEIVRVVRGEDVQ